MSKKAAGMALVVAAAAAAGILLGWQVTLPMQKSSAAPIASMQTAVAGDAAPAPAAQPEKPEKRMEPATGGATAGSDRSGFRLETRTTKIVIDPMNGRATLDVTPSVNITLDAGKRQASLDAGSVHLGVGR
jgi:hypothetical protein